MLLVPYSFTIFFLFLVVILCATKVHSTSTDDGFPVVQITNGPVMGTKYVSTYTNKAMYAFRGIPYAEPPIGDLRFKPPVARTTNWTEALNCTAYRPACLQSSANSSTSEDCLFINVYSPEINVTDGALWPVMCYLHGGAFMGGSGNDLEPDWLVAEGVVVVKANVRLGPLGFLTLGTSDTPGNQGLKDQLLGLKWIQKEIEKFGGDPNRVTLFGTSTGAQSVHLHYLSPLSKGLFHRCISESGTSLVNSVRGDGVSYSMVLANQLGCSGNVTDMESCLRKVDAQNLTDIGNAMSTPIEDNTRAETLIWRGNIDVNTTSEPFLPAWPLDLIASKEGSFVPFIMGTNRDEGILRLDTGVTTAEITNFTNNMEYLISPSVRETSSTSRIQNITKEIFKFYFNDVPPSYPDNMGDYINLYTDMYFAYGTSVSARLFRERNKVYIYLFGFHGSLVSQGLLDDEKKYNISIVAHAEEINYLWVTQGINYSVPEDSNEMKTKRRLVKLWTNFAKYGTPTVLDESLEDLQNIEWDPIDNVTTRYLHIDTNLTLVENNYLGSHAALWDGINTVPSSATFTNSYVSLAVALFVLLQMTIS